MVENTQSQKYVDRLIREWQKHGCIIIGCDYDDTISPWGFEDFELFDRVIKLIEKAQLYGAYLVIFTASDKESYPDINKFCKEKRLRVDSINTNPIPLKYGHHGKIHANIFLDDRGGLNEALYILEEALNFVTNKQI